MQNALHLICQWCCIVIGPTNNWVNKGHLSSSFASVSRKPGKTNRTHASSCLVEMSIWLDPVKEFHQLPLLDYCCFFAPSTEIHLYWIFAMFLPNPSSPLFTAIPLFTPSLTFYQPLSLFISPLSTHFPSLVSLLSQQDKMNRTEVKRESNGVITSKQTHYQVSWSGEIGVFSSTNHPFHSVCDVLRSITTN